MKIKAYTEICDNKYVVRTISNEDAEILRLWKNEHRQFFFYNKEISFDEQKLWMDQMNRRTNDFMFIVENNSVPIGCVGARVIEDFVDIYNVILGNKLYKGKHIMTEALWSVVSFCTLFFNSMPIRVRVLKSNPAIKWYEKIGFILTKDNSDYVEMQFMEKVITNHYKFNLIVYLPLKKLL